MTPNKSGPINGRVVLSETELINKSADFNSFMQKRRSVRSFSDKNISPEIIKNCIRAAGSAPSGANKQPWQFVIIGDSALKRRIRKKAEEEERNFYSERAPQKWLDDLKPLATNADKPFLEEAPYLIAVFEKKYEMTGGIKNISYYSKESTGIATGILIAAIHNAGLSCLTYTPSRMNFLNEILNRPAHERPFLILAVGYPSPEYIYPDIKRKGLDDIALFIL